MNALLPASRLNLRMAVYRTLLQLELRLRYYRAIPRWLLLVVKINKLFWSIRGIACILSIVHLLLEIIKRNYVSKFKPEAEPESQDVWIRTAKVAVYVPPLGLVYVSILS